MHFYLYLLTYLKDILMITRRIVFVVSLTLICNFIIAQITPWQAIEQMQKGINLGNTLEPPFEAGWNNPRAQEYYFDMYKEAGFTCVRVPVRWDEHTQDALPYKIDETWMQRVEEVLDWGLERDLFVIVNAHHDDWIKQNYTNPAIRDRFDSVWTQISERFKDKPEKLIFEILNEPHGLTKAQNDEMHIDLKDASVKSVGIYNISGSLVRLIDNPATESSLTITGIPAGVYFIRVSTGDRTDVRKVILNLEL